MDAKYVIYLTVFIVIGLVVIFTTLAIGDNIVPNVLGGTQNSLYTAYQQNTSKVIAGVALIGIIVTVAVATLVIRMLLGMFSTE